MDRSRTDGHTDGFVKIHLKRGTDKILGATIVASEAGEMINLITLAMNNGLGLGSIAADDLPVPCAVGGDQENCRQAQPHAASPRSRRSCARGSGAAVETSRYLHKLKSEQMSQE
ncbi:MAG: hypothetical protein R2856_37610 [Caldilineaceae bacterium]